MSDEMDKTAVVAVIDRVRHPPLRQDGAAHEEAVRPRRGQRPQRRRPRPRAGDPPAVEAEALAARRSPGAGPMIQQETRLRVADNSGAKEVLVHQGARRLHAGATPRSATSSSPPSRTPSPAPPSRRATSSSASSSASKKEKRRPDGCYIRFDENAAVLINDQQQPAWHPHLRPGRPRAARQAVHAHRLARPGGAVMTVEDQEGRPRRRAHGQGPRQGGRRHARPARARARSSSTASTSPRSTRRPTRPTMQGGIIDKDMPIDVVQRGDASARSAASPPASATSSTPTAPRSASASKCGREIS